jgi:hypothetical protein
LTLNKYMAMGPSGARCQEWPCWLLADSKLLLCSAQCLGGGGAEYLHRDPASRKRRRNGKSQIWDSKIWSRVPRDSDPRKIVLGRPSSIYKRQTRPLVREGVPQKQDRNCQIVIAKNLVMSPRWGSTPRLTNLPTVSRNVTLTLTWLQCLIFKYHRVLSDSHGKFVVWRLCMWFEDIMCAIVSGIGSVWFRETFIVSVLRSITRRGLVWRVCEICARLLNLHLIGEGQNYPLLKYAKHQRRKCNVWIKAQYRACSTD